MTPSQNANETKLLSILRMLFSRIMTMHIKIMARFNREHVNACMTPGIVTPLCEYIDKVAANAADDKGDGANSQNGVAGSNVSAHTASTPLSSSANGLGELSVYFRNNHKHSVVSLNAGDKLIQSTWEHIHASIRVAHQGDVKTARLHADLANNALKEAEHYLSAPVFSAFSQEVVKVLNEINAHSG